VIQIYGFKVDNHLHGYFQNKMYSNVELLSNFP
jgi:hypothetical protein